MYFLYLQSRNLLNRPAEAQKYKLEKLAEAHRMKTVMEAEAEAEAVRVRGEVMYLLYKNFIMNWEHIDNRMNSWFLQNIISQIHRLNTFSQTIFSAFLCYGQSFTLLDVSQAEAYAIKAKAAADAEQMAKKADAWKEYGSAAMVDMMLDTLPKVWYIFEKQICLTLKIIG